MTRETQCYFWDIKRCSAEPKHWWTLCEHGRLVFIRGYCDEHNHPLGPAWKRTTVEEIETHLVMDS